MEVDIRTNDDYLSQISTISLTLAKLQNCLRNYASRMSITIRPLHSIARYGDRRTLKHCESVTATRLAPVPLSKSQTETYERLSSRLCFCPSYTSAMLRQGLDMQRSIVENVLKLVDFPMRLRPETTLTSTPKLTYVIGDGADRLR